MLSRPTEEYLEANRQKLRNERKLSLIASRSCQQRNDVTTYFEREKKSLIANVASSKFWPTTEVRRSLRQTFLASKQDEGT